MSELTNNYILFDASTKNCYVPEFIENSSISVSECGLKKDQNNIYYIQTKNIDETTYTASSTSGAFVFTSSGYFSCWGEIIEMAVPTLSTNLLVAGSFSSDTSDLTLTLNGNESFINAVTANIIGNNVLVIGPNNMFENYLAGSISGSNITFDLA